MAIAHIATEYVFSDFLLKEPPETRYKGLRLELALDKIVTCIAVGLPLLLISLAFAQEISIGNRPLLTPPSPQLPAPADKGFGGAGLGLGREGLKKGILEVWSFVGFSCHPSGGFRSGIGAEGGFGLCGGDEGGRSIPGSAAMEQASGWPSSALLLLLLPGGTPAP